MMVSMYFNPHTNHEYIFALAPRTLKGYLPMLESYLTDRYKLYYCSFSWNDVCGELLLNPTGARSIKIKNLIKKHLGLSQIRQLSKIQFIAAIIFALDLDLVG